MPLDPNTDIKGCMLLFFSSRDRSFRRPKTKVFNKTSGVLRLSTESIYKISVTAVFNHSLESPESKAIEFAAFRDSTSSPVG